MPFGIFIWIDSASVYVVTNSVANDHNAKNSSPVSLKQPHK